MKIRMFLAALGLVFLYGCGDPSNVVEPPAKQRAPFKVTTVPVHQSATTGN